MVALNTEALLERISSNRAFESASCEMTRPANTTPYSANDIWNDSNTYNPSPFVFQFPMSWANSAVFPFRTLVASNNPTPVIQCFIVWYSTYPTSIPLDNTPFTFAAWQNRMKIYGPVGSALALAADNTSNGRFQVAIESSSTNTFSHLVLDENARLYALLKVQAYTPAAAEKMYIEVWLTRNRFRFLAEA